MQTVLVVLAVVAVFVAIGLGRSARSGDLDEFHEAPPELKQLGIERIRRRPPWVTIIGLLGAILYILFRVANERW
jgi:hypothetical protein